MSILDEIKKPVDLDLDKFEPYFRSSMSSKVPLLDVITNYIYRRKGKQLRPLLVFLSAGLNGKINQSTYVAAGMIELLHTATLIHDDVVDEAYERRSFFSINALWRSKIAVLVGDYLLSKGLLLAIEKNEIELLRIMSQAVKDMSEGELLQIEKSRRMDINESTYFEIIEKKTASLLASCSANGASSVGATPELVQRMKDFGLYLGIAFQIKDDLFDYQPKGIIGKPTGNDIKEKKLTLPLIHSLSNVSKKKQSEILKLVRSSKRNNKSVEKVVAFVQQNGGLEYAVIKMQEYKTKALEQLAFYPESEYRKSLEMLTEYIVERRK
ncbi:MAG: polyprenyl synthetase family protein [Bacteroidales bacterium]|nr:MAG: polyprenyl synthetase family protein [Bacteroidales bacterium]